jgi:nucleolar complex protein 2
MHCIKMAAVIALTRCCSHVVLLCIFSTHLTNPLHDVLLLSQNIIKRTSIKLRNIYPHQTINTMVKTTKRARKFIAKGGVKALKKDGNKKKKPKPTLNPQEAAKERADREAQQKQLAEKERDDKDFVADGNLGELDINSFFEAVGKKIEDGDSGSDEDDEAEEASENSIDEDIDDLESLGSEEEDIAASEARLKKQLEKLAEKDPEFHKYLAENESSLLEFGDDEDEDDDDMEDEMENENVEVEKQQKSKEEGDDKFLVTPQRLEQLEQSAFASHSIKGLKRIISAYKTACHLSDASTQQQQEDSDEEDAPKKKKEFQITSPVVFDRLMAVCLSGCSDEFRGHLLGESKGDDDSEESDEEGESKATANNVDVNKPLSPKTFMKSSHWPTLRPYLESFLKSTLHLLSEAGKEANLLKFVLQALANYVPFLSAFPKISKSMLKTCVKMWSAPLDTSQEYQVVRLQAFLRIRQLAITQPYPFIEECLKMTYLSYAQRSRFGTASNVTTVLPTLTFMGNCIVELYTLDYASAYQHAFVYIRQLALHLRTALMKKTKESLAVVYCWQYMHCLKLWVAVLSAACGKYGNTESDISSKLGGGAGKDEEANLLRSLVFPLTEIILGVTKLVPIAKYTPLRLHCVRLLQQLAASTESFIPTTFLLLGVLDSKEIRSKPLRDDGKSKQMSKTAVRGIRLPLILKLPKEGTLRTVEQLDAVLKETFLLLNREIDLYRYSPAFPEFTFVILQRLRKASSVVSSFIVT